MSRQAQAWRCLSSFWYPTGTVEFLKTHAEIKAMAIPHRRGVRDAEITINNTPCGVEGFQQFRAVCEKVLEVTVTRNGMTLTIYGTYQVNRLTWLRFGRY
jgi:hypothetical protein